MDTTLNTSHRDELAANLQRLVNEAEQLLKPAGQVGSEEAGGALRMAEEKLRRAKEEYLRLEETVLLNARYAGRATDRAVHEHPYAAMGIAAGVGLLLGLLIARR